ncbi:DUF5810 domain-containing protein [Halorubrum halodurans]|uniref:Uncharacterized protein n=1 Tax=Halorubrum halodurans TaxID=1383851 RepID=A0A256IAN5_9EURY|nr:DUF5810 domain-containing protein [Halorubrum halodurans]OYR53513.1 hypothetical protein DJ70_16405 [Halorubrum halodurans]
MGYACPVCATPQRDGEHLAHHLAFTAMLHGDDHETWLDEHAPAWAESEPAALAADVVEHAEPAEYHEVFEDTTDRGRPAVDAGMGGHAEGGDHGHEHGAGHGHARGHGGAGGMDPETAAAVEEARELTREMYEEGEGAIDADDGDDPDGESRAESGDGDGD